MSKADALREKSKRDDAVIVGSEIRAALQEQRDTIEQQADAIESCEADIKHMQTVVDRVALIRLDLEADVVRLETELLVIHQMGAQSDYHLVQEMSKKAKAALDKEPQIDEDAYDALDDTH